jgi:hypothetical protein
MAEDLSSHYSTLHVCGQNPCQVWAWKTLLYFWARDFRTKNREEKHGTLKGPKKGGETDTQDVIVPARYPTGMEAEVMAVTRNQSARLKLEMVVPADGALSITGYLGSSKRIPIAPSFLRRCRQKEIGNALSVPSRHNLPSFPQMQHKRSWDLLEPPHERNPPLYSAAHLHLSHGMRRQTVRTRQFRFSIPLNEFRSKCTGELEKMTLP